MNRRQTIFATWFALILFVPHPLWAHARLTKSAPAANTRLAVRPEFIRLWFSEAPELAMTRIVLADSAGKPVSVAAIERDESTLAVRFGITGHLVPGRYTVAWKTAAADGHPSHGTFAFVVLPAAAKADVPAAPVVDAGANMLRPPAVNHSPAAIPTDPAPTPETRPTSRCVHCPSPVCCR